MVNEYGNHPLAWNYHHWTIVLFAYFDLDQESFLFIAFDAVKFMACFIILSWKLFLITDKTTRVIIVFLQMASEAL